MNLLDTREFDVVLVGLQATSERQSIEKLQRDKNVPVIFLCCDQFDPAGGTCKCQESCLSSEELLCQIANAVSLAQLRPALCVGIR